VSDIKEVKDDDVWDRPLFPGICDDVPREQKSRISKYGRSNFAHNEMCWCTVSDEQLSATGRTMAQSWVRGITRSHQTLGVRCLQDWHQEKHEISKWTWWNVLDTGNPELG
jgi:hypothetical protein